MKKKCLKICIVQFGRIGDLILMTPMFQAIKDANSDNKIHILAGRNNYHFAENDPLIDCVHVYEKKPWDTLQFILSLRREEFDIWIDPKDHFSIESYCFAKFAKADLRVGHNPKGRSLFQQNIPSDSEQSNMHAVERNLSALRKAGIPATVHRPVLFTQKASDKQLDTFLKHHEIAEYICINLSANNKARYWPEENWNHLLSRLIEDNRKVLLTCKPEDKGLAQRLEHPDHQIFYYPTKSLYAVFSVIRGARLIITPDTAVVHMAAAFNVPIIGLYANRPNNINKFRPLSEISQIIVDPVSKDTIYHIEVDRVYNAVHEIL